MDAPKVPNTPPALSIVPATFEIVLAEDSGNPLSFVSPPLQDISEMAELERSCFSLNQGSHVADIVHDGVKQRLAELSQKSEKFSGSATFYNRLANLQRALGNLSEEAASLERASAIDASYFFRRKIGENLMRAGNRAAARDLFLGLATDDAYSALRMASLCVVSKDIEGADEWVDKAVELEPDGYAERLFQGAIKLIKGDFSSAIRVLWMAINERPTSSVAYCNLALAYLGSSNAKRAFDCLKRSVALDPFNRSAVLAFADVGFFLGRDTDVVNSLRYYAGFEQREPAIWGRLARSLLKLGLVDECIAALKRQGALEKSVSLWNNLGVAYAKRGYKEQSLQAFNYALTVDGNGGSRDELMVARNIAQLVSTLGKPELLRSVTGSLIEQDQDFKLARDPQLCDLYGFHISALIKLGKRDEGLALAEHLLGLPDIGGALANWLVQSLAAIYGLDRSSDESLSLIMDAFLSSKRSASKDVGLMNNVAFALAELGRLEEAEQCIAAVSHSLHKDAYLTATLGLINFRKGRIDRGERLYKEAIALGRTAHDKARIRQKFFLEVGRASAGNDAKVSRRALEKVVAEKQGERVLVKQANQFLRLLAKS